MARRSDSDFGKRTGGLGASVRLQRTCKVAASNSVGKGGRPGDVFFDLAEKKNFSPKNGLKEVHNPKVSHFKVHCPIAILKAGACSKQNGRIFVKSGAKSAGGKGDFPDPQQAAKSLVSLF
jgi:hypothetical protein